MSIEEIFIFSDIDFESPEALVKALLNKIQHISQDKYLALAQDLNDALQQRQKSLKSLVGMYGETALNLACCNDSGVMREGIACYGNTEIVKVLLMADTNHELLLQTTDVGESALYSATVSNREDIVRLLLNADTEGKLLMLQERNFRETPLHIAAYRGYKEITKCLLDADTNGHLIWKYDDIDQTPLRVAAKNGKTEICRLILAAAGPNMRKLLEEKNYFGKTPADQAAENKHLGTAQFLIDVKDALDRGDKKKIQLLLAD